MRPLPPAVLVALALAAGPSLAATAVPGNTVQETGVVDAFAAWGAMGNTMVEKDGHVFLIYYTDRASSVPVYVVHRTPDGVWHPRVVVGTASDDHGYPAIAMDSQGYLHIITGGPHANPLRPLVYRSSVDPMDASAWTAPVTLTSVQGSSYTNLVVDAADTLYLTYREDGSDDGDLILRTKAAGGSWSSPLVLADEPAYSAYPYDLLVDGPDIHVAFSWRDCRSCPWSDPTYMVSRDGGATWKDGIGTALTLPVRRATIAPIVHFRSGLSLDINLLPTPSGLQATFIHGIGAYAPTETQPLAGADPLETDVELWHAALGPSGWTARPIRHGPFIVYKATYQEGAIQLVTTGADGAMDRVYSTDNGQTWLGAPAWADPPLADAHAFVHKGRNGGDPPTTLTGLAASRPETGGTHIVWFELAPLSSIAGVPEPGFCQVPEGCPLVTSSDGIRRTIGPPLGPIVQLVAETLAETVAAVEELLPA